MIMMLCSFVLYPGPVIAYSEAARKAGEYALNIPGLRVLVLVVQ